MRLLDPEEALRIWCTRSEVGSVFVPLKRESEGPEPVDYDYELSVKMRVDLWLDTQPRGSAEIIRFKIGLGRPVSEFVWRGPGETRMRALLSWGWGYARKIDPMPEVWDRTFDDFCEWWERSGVQACAVAPIIERDEDVYVVRDVERISLADAANSMRISYDAARMMVKRGTLPAYKWQGKWWVVKGELP